MILTFRHGTEIATLRIAMSRILGISILFLLSISVLQAETYLACKQTQQVGLFEQCEEVKIMKFLGPQTRVYSLAKKRLISWETKNIFAARPLSSNETLKSQDLLTIPGQLIWGSSTKLHQTLCRVSESNENHKILNLDCGKNSSQKVNRQLVYRLSQIPESAVFEKSYQSKK